MPLAYDPVPNATPELLPSVDATVAPLPIATPYATLLATTPIATELSAAAVAAVPIATALPAAAVEALPIAMEFVPLAVATGPIAVAFEPLADESPNDEFVWKYLMPPPFTMLLTVLLVAYSCEPFTASVLVDDSVPAWRLTILLLFMLTVFNMLMPAVPNISSSPFEKPVILAVEIA
nr:hypothetical protein [Paraburkholderia sp.]